MESGSGHERLSSTGKFDFITQRSNLLSYGLLALCYVLVISLFIVVVSHNSSASSAEFASKSGLQSLVLAADGLSTRMKQLQGTKKSCETNWKEFKGSCYLFINSKSNWVKARSMCIQKQGDLVVINNDEEQKFLSGKTGDTQYWIGLNDMEEDGKWTWVDKSDYLSSYRSWMTNKPSNSEAMDDCAYISTQGKWNNQQCSHDQYSAICEKKM